MNKIQLNEYLKIAKELIVKDGKLMPVAFLKVKGEESPVIAGLEIPEDQRTRQFMFFKLGAKVRLDRKEIDEITFLSEVWYSNPSKDKFDENKFIMPSQDPEKKEAIMILSADIKGKYNFSIQPFKKEGEKITFEKDEKVETDTADKFEDNLLKWFWRGYELNINKKDENL